MNNAKLNSRELKLLLIGMTPQQKRVVQGIHDNQGIWTHDAFGEFYANNISHVARKANDKMHKQGVLIKCEKPSVPHDYTKSERWYLVRIGDIQTLDNSEDSANDESFD